MEDIFNKLKKLDSEYYFTSRMISWLDVNINEYEAHRASLEIVIEMTYDSIHDIMIKRKAAKTSAEKNIVQEEFDKEMELFNYFNKDLIESKKKISFFETSKPKHLEKLSTLNVEKQILFSQGNSITF